MLSGDRTEDSAWAPGDLFHDALSAWQHECDDYGDERGNFRTGEPCKHPHDLICGTSASLIFRHDEDSP